ADHGDRRAALRVHRRRGDRRRAAGPRGLDPRSLREAIRRRARRRRPLPRRPALTVPLNGFGQAYVAALEGYLANGDEAALSRSYEFGRSAMARGMGVLDMAALHQAAVAILVVAVSPA